MRKVEGFGDNSRIHTSSILRLSEDLPIVVEIVSDGLITVYECAVIQHVYDPR